jgi:PBP1b-binding outer membrane lipoprotein LpoB
MRRGSRISPVVLVTLLMAAMVAFFLTGCLDSRPSAAPETSTTAASATTIAPSPPSVPEVLSVEAVLDPSLSPADQTDPYAVMDPTWRTSGPPPAPPPAGN